MHDAQRPPCGQYQKAASRARSLAVDMAGNEVAIGHRGAGSGVRKAGAMPRAGTFKLRVGFKVVSTVTKITDTHGMGSPIGWCVDFNPRICSFGRAPVVQRLATADDPTKRGSHESVRVDG